MKIIILPLILALCLASCTDDYQSVGEKEFTKKETNINFRALFSEYHTISKEEAQKKAEEAFSRFYTTETKGLKRSNRRIHSVSILEGNNELRSSLSTSTKDTLAYIFNYADSSGYVVVCADDRLWGQILACTDKGFLDPNDENLHPSLKLFLQNTKNYIKREISKFEKSKDSLKLEARKHMVLVETNTEHSNQLKGVYTGTIYIPVYEEYVGPLLETHWEQSLEPFNDFTPTCNIPGHDHHCPAGCWAVALGQVMAYWQYPISINGYTFYWDQMTANPYPTIHNTTPYAYHNIGTLLAYIGLSCNMDYGCEKSGALASDVVSFASSLGYNTSSANYSWSSLKSKIDQHKPVCMTGRTNDDEGHAWVADGYRKDTQICQHYRVNTDNNTYEITSSSVVYFYYIHNNWGWGGSHNGYFEEGCFDVDSPYELDSNYIGDCGYSFNNRVKMFIFSL